MQDCRPGLLRQGESRNFARIERQGDRLGRGPRRQGPVQRIVLDDAFCPFVPSRGWICRRRGLRLERASRPPTPRPRPSPRPRRARRRRRPSHRLSPISAIGTCSSERSARVASATRSLSRNRANPRASPAIRVMRSFRTARPKGCATKCLSSWASTSRAATRPKPAPRQSRGEDLEVEREIEDASRLGPGRLGRRGAVRDASQGRKPLGQERGERERADRRNAERGEARGQGRLA